MKGFHARATNTSLFSSSSYPQVSLVFKLNTFILMDLNRTMPSDSRYGSATEGRSGGVKKNCGSSNSSRTNQRQQQQRQPSPHRRHSLSRNSRRERVHPRRVPLGCSMVSTRSPPILRSIRRRFITIHRTGQMLSLFSSYT